jgi:putative ABC transport system permease protein
MSFLWNKFSFSIKSSLRNVFRNKKNLILTTLSVIGSVVLVFIGFALYNAASSMTDVPMYKNLASNMGTLSTIVVLFGLLMSVLVIYALASMNIDERVREIAVLKVLGYHDNESALYACRELFFITAFAAAIGIPIALGITALIFDTLEFAKINAIHWSSYVLSYFIVLSSSIISSFMLYPKIKKIDFNISLKSVE